MNEHTNAPANEGRLKVISEFETCNEKLKVRYQERVHVPFFFVEVMFHF